MNPSINLSWHRLTSSFSGSHLPPLPTAGNGSTPVLLGPAGSSKHISGNLSFSELTDLGRSPITLKKNAQRRLRQTVSPSDSKLNRTFSVRDRELVDGLSDLQLRLIYEAKCEDLKIQVLPLQEKRFAEYCCKYLKNRDFNLKESGIGPKAGKAIAECVRNNHSFCKLTLAKNVLGDEGAVQIAKILAKAYNIIHIDVSSNSLSPDGLSEILKVLTPHESLVNLDISSHEGLHRNRLGPLGARAVSFLLSRNSLLISLNISGTAIGPEGLEQIASGLSVNRTLQILGLANNALTAKGLDRFMKAVAMSKVAHLNLACNALGYNGAESIANALAGTNHQSCRLKMLDLSETKLNFAGCEKIFYAMTRNSSLDTLILEENPIGPLLNMSLVNMLCDNFTLRVLNMSSCGLRKSGAMAFGEGLSKNHSIKVLLAASNAMEDEQISVFAHGLMRNSAVSTLDLSNNRLSEKSGMLLCSALRTHPTIAQLLLKDNDLKEQTAQLLADMTRTRKNLIRVNIDNNPISYKYIVEIKENVTCNLKSQGANRAPVLLRELRELRLLDTNVDSIVNDIRKLKAEETGLLEQIERQKERYEQCRVSEEAKTAIIMKESEMVHKKMQNVMAEYFRLMQEVKDEGVKGAMEIRVWEEKLNTAHNELVRKERECSWLKNNSIGLRTQFTDKINRMEEELKAQKSSKKNFEVSLLSLHKQVEIFRFENEQGEPARPVRTSFDSGNQKVLKMSKAKKKKKAKKDAKS